MKFIKSTVLILCIYICFTMSDIHFVYAEETDIISDEDLWTIVEDVSNKYDNISAELLFALCETESSKHTRAVNKYGDCYGLTQINTYWHRDRMEKLGVTDIYEPYSNVLVCADYLSELIEDTGNIKYALMAYNMGGEEAKPVYSGGYISEYATTIYNRMDELTDVNTIKSNNDMDETTLAAIKEQKHQQILVQTDMPKKNENVDIDHIMVISCLNFITKY